MISRAFSMSHQILRHTYDWEKKNLKGKEFPNKFYYIQCEGNQLKSQDIFLSQNILGNIYEVFNMSKKISMHNGKHTAKEEGCSVQNSVASEMQL